MVTTPKRKDVFYILPSREVFICLPQKMKIVFSELKIAANLRAVHISKSKGDSCLTLFMIIFLLSFKQQTWFQEKCYGHQSADLPGKDVIYRFLNQPTYNWRKFLLSLSRAHLRTLKLWSFLGFMALLLLIGANLISRNEQKVYTLSAAYCFKK